jgi:succinyl-CoA synthetase alpha subunit
MFCRLHAGLQCARVQPGDVGVISRSGSLGTLLCLNLVQAGLGVRRSSASAAIPASAPPPGCADRARSDQTRTIALVGEIGGSMEEEAAEYARTMTKPIAAFIAGAASPAGKRMGRRRVVMGDRAAMPQRSRAGGRRRRRMRDAHGVAGPRGVERRRNLTLPRLFRARA